MLCLYKPVVYLCLFMFGYARPEHVRSVE